MKNRLLLFFKYYFPALLWMGIVFYLSSVPDLRVGSQSLLWEILWRKMAHIGEYMVLAWLIFRIFYSGYDYKRKDSFVAAVMFVGVYAISDELHQIFVPGRTGKVIDIVVDILGGTLGLYIISFFYGAVFSAKKIIIIAALSIALIFSVKVTVKDGELATNQKNLEADIQKKNEAMERGLTITVPSGNQKNAANDSQGNITASSPELSTKIQIDVPFTSQAPLADWDAYHEEACEEAAIIMTRFFIDEKKITPEIASSEISNMINFEIKNYGDYKDSTASQMVKLADDFYGPLPDGKKLQAIYDIKRQDLKTYLSKGNPIIVPAAGRLLGNPNFTSPGPLYHALVLTGYDGNEIITNDPGTRKGKSYRYNIDILYNAIHDFPGSIDNIENGRKAMIVIE